MLRVVALLIWLTVAALLIVEPEAGLTLFWGLVVPIVPALVVIAPGLWRQVCPMAFANQMPGRIGLSFGWSLPPALQKWAFTIAAGLFVGIIGLRQMIFNQTGWATASLLLAALGLAFLGGAFFKARSGWCGTFCPLGPIQRVYGHSPAVAVPQTYCASCVGCQKNCYDFNQRAAVLDDIYDEDPRYAGQRRAFMALVPGLVLAYFLQGSHFHYSQAIYVAILLAGPLISIGLFHLIVSYTSLSPYRAATIFGASALIFFYWFAGPTMLQTLLLQLDLQASPEAITFGRAIGPVVALSLLVLSDDNERLYQDAADKARAEAAVAVKKEGFEVIDGDKCYIARPGQLLLEVLLGSGVSVEANCRSGLCGSDAVAIISGEDNLSLVTDDERATLKRLGLTGQARLSCSARVNGPVTISRNVALGQPDASVTTASAPEVVRERIDFALRTQSGAQALTLDRAASAGISDVIIIGNGVAGVTAADELRKASPSINITIISVEPHHFYNRMALMKLVTGEKDVGDLHIQPPEWYTDNRIDVLLGLRVVAIDRRHQSVILEDGTNLRYDRLILATGASASSPGVDFLKRDNAFVLRAAEDAKAMMDCIAQRGSRTACVVGGGVLGVEVAEGLCRMGIATTLVVRSTHLMDRNLDQDGALLLQKYLESIGVTVRCGVSVTSYEGPAMLERAWLQDGSQITADLFVACLGSRPNIELAVNCGLETRTGIRVNPLMMTSDQNIYAIGDVAELEGAQLGLWPIAVAQANVAVQAMLGVGERYSEPRIMMRLKSNGVDVRSFGRMHAAAGDDTIAARPFSGDWWRLVLRGNRITAACFVGEMCHTNPLWALVQTDNDIAPYRDDLREGRLERLRAL